MSWKMSEKQLDRPLFGICINHRRCLIISERIIYRYVYYRHNENNSISNCTWRNRVALLKVHFVIGSLPTHAFFSKKVENLHYWVYISLQLYILFMCKVLNFLANSFAWRSNRRIVDLNTMHVAYACETQNWLEIW